MRSAEKTLLDELGRLRRQQTQYRQAAEAARDRSARHRRMRTVKRLEDEIRSLETALDRMLETPTPAPP